ncbi:MAG: phosphate signaling complex protein PhoU [Treponema sp.]|nr:phosphate signaling complex protein PhoU [Spirochaetia bacterium]MDD7610206.1 phosphate signaling complex protein PhoU [Spirochaetales bacterium]MDY4525912.1 phosphate signaling complex protein PhoU [Treponema sp.]MDY4832523.1 phosphate signaling complex protein PhoU [Treponema sp.]MDY5913694.1 phosphate signaling complex protein PhoU [Treponema sp.]
MRDKYQEDLEKLNANILKMGKMIEIAIESTVIALMGRDIQAASTVSENDEAIDNMEREIEALCMKLLLQQQPVATDLRVITAALKMVTDMERIGDHAADIAELVLQIPDCKYNKMDTITEISTQIIKMIHDSVNSFIQRNYDKAQIVIAQDDIVDNLYHEIKSDLIQKIKKTDDGEQILDYLLIARYFERIGDHATNIAKWVVFAITGKK